MDWSANNAPKLGPDSIWMYRNRGSNPPLCENVGTRVDAMARIEGTLQAALKLKRRLFIGLDFGFGYPLGSAAVMGLGNSARSNWLDRVKSLMGAHQISGRPSWLDVWSTICARIEDSKDNESNRFDVASQLNALFRSALGETPFWGMPHTHAGRYADLGPTRPSYRSIDEKRIVETMLPSAQPQWKLAYTGSVGSQSLLGIAHFGRLRAQYGDVVAIWPFETRFAQDLSKPVVVAEIYPSMLPVTQRNGEVKDAAQVRTMADTFARLDADGGLETLLSAPPGLTAVQTSVVLREEGWIVGVGHDLGRAQTVASSL
ncbi:MAG: hypothetical protein AAF890_08465 [Pseudomonadota bacterium]